MTALYRVTAWQVITDRFAGIVYTSKIALDKLAEATEGSVRIVHFTRDHEPLPHMTYERIPQVSGYLPCACRDCFDIAIGTGPTLCTDCDDAGCEINDGECCRPDAYDTED